jgi:hypothetical protein
VQRRWFEDWDLDQRAEVKIKTKREREREKTKLTKEIGRSYSNESKKKE